MDNMNEDAIRAPARRLGACKSCGKHKIKTIHIGCNHLCCCLTCARSCRQCQMCGEEVTEHLRVYLDSVETNQNQQPGTERDQATAGSSGAGDDNNETVMAIQVDDGKSTSTTADGDDIALALGEPIKATKVPKKHPNDEPYDPDNDTLGTCPVCLENPIDTILMAWARICGHGQCRGCGSQLEYPQRPDQCRDCRMDSTFTCGHGICQRCYSKLKVCAGECPRCCSELGNEYAKCPYCYKKATTELIPQFLIQ